MKLLTERFLSVCFAGLILVTLIAVFLPCGLYYMATGKDITKQLVNELK